ncbi:MAG TPA: PAS domain S-box protein [Leptolyngbyaceae cyanobacterium]
MTIAISETESTRKTNTVSRLQVFSHIASIGVVAIGILVFIGWLFDIAHFKSVWPGLVTMKANTAFCLIASGASLWEFGYYQAELEKRKLLRGKVLAVTVIIIGILTILEYGFGWNFGIDNLLFKDSVVTVRTLASGRMELNTAVTLTVVGFALLFLYGSAYYTAQILATIGLATALLGSFGYLDKIVFFYTPIGGASMALHTAIGLILLCSAVLCARPQQGLMMVFTSDRIGGAMLRYLFPTLLIVSSALSLLILAGKRYEWYGVEEAIAILAIGNMVMFAIPIWWNAYSLNTIESDRQNIQQRLQLLLEASENGLWDWNIVTGEVYFSPQFLSMSGYSVGELEGNINTSIGLVHPEDLPQMKAVLDAHLEGTTPSYEVEFRFRTQSGSWQWILDSGKVVERDRNDRPLRMVGTHKDISDRKRAEQERDRFFTLPLDLLCIADTNGYFKCLNPAWEVTCGYTQAELKSKPFIEFVHPDDREATIAAVAKLARGEKLVSLENRYLCQDGSYKWIAWNCVPFPEEGLIYAIARDISDRKQTEQTLIERNELLKSVIESTTDPIFVKDIQGRYTLVNVRCASILGKSKVEIIGKDDTAFFPPEMISDIRQTERRIMETGIAETAEENVPENGIWKIFLTTKSPWRDIDGNIIGTVGFARDISDRKQAEAVVAATAQREQLINHLCGQIRASLELDTILATTVAQIHDLLEIDRCTFLWYFPETNPPFLQGVHESKNEDLFSMLGNYTIDDRTASAIANLAKSEIIRIDNVETVSNTDEREFWQYFGGCKSLLNFVIRSASGTIGVLACATCQNIRNWTDNEVELLQAVCNQLAIAISQAELYEQSRTAAKLAQENSEEIAQTLKQLKKTQAQLIQAEKMSSLGQMVAGIAHEINNPVSFIFGNIVHAEDYSQQIIQLLELYGREYPNSTANIRQKIEQIDLNYLIEDLPKLLSSMKIGASRIKDIVRSLRIFSRLDESEMKAIDIHESIDSTLLILEYRLKQQGNQPAIKVIKSYGKLPLIECYAGQLNQVFMNIFSNAIDALEALMENSSNGNEQARKNPNISIYTEASGDFVTIKIADNGIGMTKEVKQRIFDPFFTTKEVGKGTGMGLAIAHSIIVEKHKGSLQCFSKVGVGTEFRIQIPNISSN